jgi:hypothetical protein
MEPALGIPAGLATPPSRRVKRHLILAFRPGWQSLDDLNEIAGYVTEFDPTIRVFILPTTVRNVVTRRIAATKPTLIVSNGRMLVFRPLRGKVYQGWPIPKFEEVRRLREAGVPVPRTEILTPKTDLNPDLWGEFVIVKPTDIATSSKGRGIQLMRTRRVRYRAPHEYPEDHPGQLGPMMIQQYVNSGDHVSIYRVLSFLGKTMYAQDKVVRSKKIDLTASDEEIENAPITDQSGEVDRILRVWPEAVDIARRAHAAFPEVPLVGVDVIRDETTGKIYVLELNSGGNTWHFSSGLVAAVRKLNGPDFEAARRSQFDAFRTAARALVEKTNAEAS